MEDVIEQIVNAILEGKIIFPYAKYYLPTPEKMFDNLKKYEPSLNFQEYQIKCYHPRGKLYLPPLFLGNYLSIISPDDSYETIEGLTDWFTEEERNKSKKRYDISVSEAWKDKTKLKAIVKSAISEGEISNKSLRNAIYKTVREPGLFKLPWAKGLLVIIEEYIRSDKTIKILDPSAGWGDRLIASISMNFEYTGYDPNKNLKSGHDAIIAKFGDLTKHRVIYEPFETAKVTDTYDIVFTSPPYYNLEIYSDDPNQSNLKYPSLNEWLNGFLFRYLKNAWSALKDNGILMLHLCDAGDINITELTNLYIEKNLPGSSWMGIIGVTGSRRHHYPVWIWRKTSGRRSIWNSQYNRSLQSIYSDIKITV